MHSEPFNLFNLIWMIPLGLLNIFIFVNGLILLHFFVHEFIYRSCSFIPYEGLRRFISKFAVILLWIVITILPDASKGLGWFLLSLFLVAAYIMGITYAWSLIPNSRAVKWIHTLTAHLQVNNHQQTSSYNNFGKHYVPPHEPHNAPPHEPPHTEHHEDTTQASAIKLVNLGLACIGRKTKHSNLYLTGMESKRQQAEYTFLRQVAEKYRDAGARKVIARHFMLYKECCLYIIYSVVLKHEPELHRLVRVELTEQLTDGLTAEAKARRKEYMYAFSRAFYDEYQRTKSKPKTLSFMFWSVLCIKHPELVSAPELPELMGINGWLGSIGIRKRH